jgi:hypothetical protein
MLDELVKVFDDFTKKGRIQELETLSREHGIPFKRKMGYEKRPTKLKGFKPFVKKGTKRMIGVMEVTPTQFEGEIKFYDYLRTKDLETKSQSTIEVYCKELDSPYCMVSPKSAFKKMKNIFVTEDMELPFVYEFHRKYFISEDTEDVFILRPSVMELMADHKGLTLEAKGDYLLLYYKNKEIKVHQVLEHLKLAEELVALICYDDSEDYV